VISAPESNNPVRHVLANWFAFSALLAALGILLPLHMEAEGFGVDSIAAVSGAAGLGGLLSAELVGQLAARLGPVRLMRLAVGIMAVSFVCFGLSATFVILLVMSGLTGVSMAMIRVAAQMLVRNRVDEQRRGRVHAWQGQTTRLTVLIIPVVVGAMWEPLSTELNFTLPVLLTFAAVGAGGSLVVVGAREVARSDPTITSLTTMLGYASGPMLFIAARKGRTLLLPLVGLELGLTPARIGLLLGLTAAADLLVSPISGPLMDKRGRLATIVPSFSLTALGFVVLAASSGGFMLGLAAVILGAANGLTAGLILTLGTDLAPHGKEGPFLGRFGALGDIGRLIAPFLIGLLGRLVGLNAAALALAVVSVLALGFVITFIGETKPAV